uniref:Uncharacterized protein n=1 Tax=Ditylum brightwellii TaxID=49249 RepID=A0A6V2QJN0_9STRA|mmetsp:Transcript_6043/g.8899  ORF Transcript_6043/g.8899 Transcript_6043/m.8899 type:complete len:271 (-) Transcript_6043:215-1027(-)
MPNTCEETPQTSQEHDDKEMVRLTFDLHPNRTLRLSIHEKVKNVSELSDRAFSYNGVTDSNNEKDKKEKDEKMHIDEEGCGRFAIMDAKRITSLTHLAMAANTALLRSARSSNKTTENNNSSSGTKRKRGIALETIVCAGGSSNVGNVLKEFTFSSSGGKEKIATEEVVMAMGYDCSNDGEYESFLSDIGLTNSTAASSEEKEDDNDNHAPKSKRLPIQMYLQRDRTESDVKDLMRVFKLTKEEINMGQGLGKSSLDMAVVNRVATKFTV